MNTPRVFLSYTRADLPVVQQLEQGLTANGVSVWRDQEKIYGGQKWPKVLGEEISRHDFLLLAWSENSKQSHFVELEWCTAVALKKIIVPCLLDDTPLPASLKAMHAVDAKEPAKAVPEILNALRSEVPEVDLAHDAEVIRKLGNISAMKPKEVLEAARAIFDQRGWTVQGSVYQAARDVNVTIAQPSPTTPKTLLEKWQTRVALCVGILTVLFLGFQVKDRIFPAPPKPLPEIKSAVPEAPPQPIEQSLVGFIRNEHGDPLPDVQVDLPEFKMTATTDPLGQFQFRVKAPKQQTVALIAQKKNYEIDERDVTLGNTNFSFTMRRKAR